MKTTVDVHTRRDHGVLMCNLGVGIFDLSKQLMEALTS